MWWIYALLSAFFAAVTAILAKVGVKGVNSDLATAIRTTVVLFITWGIAFFRKGTANITTISQYNLFFLGLSGIATGLSWIFYFKALQLGKIAQVAAVDKLSVAFAIFLSVLLLGESLTWKEAAGAACIIAGTLILIL